MSDDSITDGETAVDTRSDGETGTDPGSDAAIDADTAAEPDGDTDHLSNVPDGCGCAEVWEHTSEVRAED